MQLEEEAAGIAQDGARLVAAPERSGARGAVLADRLGRGQCQAAQRWMGSSAIDWRYDKDKARFWRAVRARATAQHERVRLTGEFACPPDVAGAAVA